MDKIRKLLNKLSTGWKLSLVGGIMIQRRLSGVEPEPLAENVAVFVAMLWVDQALAFAVPFDQK